jgi:hypothetical protein
VPTLQRDRLDALPGVKIEIQHERRRPSAKKGFEN